MAVNAGAHGIGVVGLIEVQRALRQVSDELPRELRQLHKRVSEIVARNAQGRAPELSGRLRASLVARAEQRGASIKGGGARVPYYGFIDFGGRVGRNKSVERPFIREGRIIFPAIVATRDEALETYDEGMADLLDRAHLT
ncbi:MAG TPA: hypothetical protein VHC63_13325 [Acidimicrobiales bacterium]|nr:hypothetical protein [Acidimicrobiales bacterium]